MSRLVLFVLSFLTSIPCCVGIANADLLYEASLKNGDYGAGFEVGGPNPNGTFYNASGSTGGNLEMLGIVDSSAGVTFTTPYDVINFSLGADGKSQTSFAAHGTASVAFLADGGAFTSGQPFVDNYGFNGTRNGQATFGTFLSRDAGADGVLMTDDDKISVGWHTWHNSVWYSHVGTPVLLDFDEWHSIGFTWGGPVNDFEVWVDGELLAWNNLPPGVSTTWGHWYPASLYPAYNFALGMIHERGYSTSNSPTGITFADLAIWDEYRELGNTIPEPHGVLLLLMGWLTSLPMRVRHSR